MQKTRQHRPATVSILVREVIDTVSKDVLEAYLEGFTSKRPHLQQLSLCLTSNVHTTEIHT
jgi:hypothetical protein